MGQVHHRHTHPMWYSPQQTLTHGTSTSQTHTPMWYSPQRTLTHGMSTSQTHTSHVVQSAADSHAWDEYITDTHIPCGTVHSGLSRMRQIHHRHTHIPCGTVRSGLSRMGQVHHRHTQPMWYSPQRTRTHGTSTSQTYSLCGNMYTTLMFIITDKYYTKTLYLQVVLYSTPSRSKSSSELSSLASSTVSRGGGGKLRWDRLRLRNVFPDCPPDKLLRKAAIHGWPTDPFSSHITIAGC